MQNQESNSIYNIVSIVFLVLSLCICLTTVGMISGAVPVPGPLEPATDVPLPTLGTPASLTPTNTFTVTPQPTWTPFGTAAPTLTETPVTPAPAPGSG